MRDLLQEQHLNGKVGILTGVGFGGCCCCGITNDDAVSGVSSLATILSSVILVSTSSCF